MRNKGLVVLMAVFVLLLLTDSLFSCEGCTIGFWKNHPDAWQGGFSPYQTLASVFDFSLASDPNVLNLQGDSLLMALSYTGGPGVFGATKLYLKQAVAALLNIAAYEAGLFHFHTEYSFNVIQFELEVRQTLGGSRDTLLIYSGYLEGLNASGCPIDGK